MLRSVFRKMIDSRLPQNEPWILYEAIKLYGKNAATALLFSVFMMLFPYLHFVLLHNNAPLHICAVLISAGAFISSNLLYAPFIASVHRRKTSSQKKTCLEQTFDEFTSMGIGTWCSFFCFRFSPPEISGTCFSRQNLFFHIAF